MMMVSAKVALMTTVKYVLILIHVQIVPQVILILEEFVYNV